MYCCGASVLAPILTCIQLKTGEVVVRPVLLLGRDLCTKIRIGGGGGQQAETETTLPPFDNPRPGWGGGGICRVIAPISGRDIQQLG
jgi:hypothetical protein